MRDVRRGFAAHARWLQEPPAFRPPHGKLNVFTWLEALRRRARFGWWSHDSGDSWSELPEASGVVESVRLAGGGVVLMHDFDRSEERERYVVDVTCALIDMARDEGIAVVTMAQLLKGGSEPEARR